jgi:hypothetical protein
MARWLSWILQRFRLLSKMSFPGWDVQARANRRFASVCQKRFLGKANNNFFWFLNLLSRIVIFSLRCQYYEFLLDLDPSSLFLIMLLCHLFIGCGDLHHGRVLIAPLFPMRSAYLCGRVPELVLGENAWLASPTKGIRWKKRLRQWAFWVNHILNGLESVFLTMICERAGSLPLNWFNSLVPHFLGLASGGLSMPAVLTINQLEEYNGTCGHYWRVLDDSWQY